LTPPALQTLVLFSGLGADANVFFPQKLAFPDLIVPPWPMPLPEDTLESYCDRIAEELRPYPRPILGGASFGGIIALHVAERIPAAAVVLIGSVRSPGELPRFVRLARPLRPLVRILPVRVLQWCSVPLGWRFFRRHAPHLSGLARQFRGANPRVFKWSVERVLDWTSTPIPACPIFQIHGDRDAVLPMRRTSPDTVVRGGGHVISLSHASEVNDFLRAVLHRHHEGVFATTRDRVDSGVDESQPSESHRSERNERV
jgi:pimeloyl-ACP methyl ester carboxylesterase